MDDDYWTEEQTKILKDMLQNDGPNRRTERIRHKLDRQKTEAQIEQKISEMKKDDDLVLYEHADLSLGSSSVGAHQRLLKRMGFDLPLPPKKKAKILGDGEANMGSHLCLSVGHGESSSKGKGKAPQTKASRFESVKHQIVPGENKNLNQTAKNLMIVAQKFQKQGDDHTANMELLKLVIEDIKSILENNRK